MLTFMARTCWDKKIDTSEYGLSSKSDEYESVRIPSPFLNQRLVNVPFWGLVSHHQTKYLLENYIPNSWVYLYLGHLPLRNPIKTYKNHGFPPGQGGYLGHLNHKWDVEVS